MASRVNVEFWSDWECAGGQVICRVAKPEALIVPPSLDNTGQAQLKLPWSDPCLRDIGLRDVMRITQRIEQPDGTYIDRVWEHRVAIIDDSRKAGSAESVTILADPPIVDLGKCGPVSEVDWRHWYNLGYENATPEQYIKGLILPTLTRLGLTYYAIGTLEFTDRLDIAGERWSPLQWLHEIEAQVGGELALRRNGSTNFLIDIVEERNANMPVVALRTDKQVQTLARSRRAAPLTNVIIPVGIVPSGDVEAATIAYAAFEVTAKSGDILTLGGSPIQFDDQLNGLYALAPDATLKQIVDSVAATQQITLAAGGGAAFAVTDYVEFRADSNGTLLTEISNPASVAEFKRCAASVEVSEARGERNHWKNAFYDSWTPNGFGDALKCTATPNPANSTTIDLTGLTAGAVVNVGDVLTPFTVGAQVYRVTVGGTADGSGNLTVTVAGSTWTGARDAALWRSNANPAGGWVRQNNARIFVRYYPALAALSGQINGNQSVSSTGLFDVSLKGLGATKDVQPGDWLVVAAVRYLIVSPTQTDGSGNATVRIFATAGVSFINNANVTITRLDVTGVRFGAYCAWLPTVALRTDVGGDTRFGWDGPSYKIRHNPLGMPPVYASVGLTVRNQTAGSLTLRSGASGSQIGTVKVEAIDADDNTTVLGTVTDPDRTLAAGEYQHFVLRIPLQLAASKNIKLRVYGLFIQAAGVTFRSMIPDADVFVRWVMLHVGFDPSPPPVKDSHANTMWRFGTAKCASTSEEPLMLRATIADLAAINKHLSAELLDVGQTVKLTATDMAGGMTLTRTARITQIVFDLLNPLNTQVQFETLSPRITKLLNRARIRKIAVEIAVTTRNDTGAIVSAADAAANNIPTTTTQTNLSAGAATSQGGAPNPQPVAASGTYRGTVQNETTDPGTNPPILTRYKKGASIY